VRFLLRPGWLAFIALVVGFAVACYALLAPWQFGRERQREAQEQAIATADATPPVPLAELVPPGSAVTQELEWRRVTVTGTYLAEAEALVRLRTLDSKAAVEVLTPMRLDDGRVVAVDRGLATLTDAGAVPAYPASPGGTVTVTARLRTDRHDPSDRPVVRGAGPPQLYAADSTVLGATTGLDLVAGILQLPADQPGVLAPAPVGPSVADAAPFTNFSYALQWWTFGLIALVALGYFIRLEMLQRRGGGSRRTRRTEVRRALAGDDIAGGRPVDPATESRADPVVPPGRF
jgi:cytochrome oxidase assembly protein ShyY1